MSKIVPFFLGKVFIRGRIKALTGLHIGGSKSALDIGGIDLNVIKTAKGDVPFIPGSSLKGKLRSMLARVEGSLSTGADSPTIKDIFGYTADEDGAQRIPTRLMVRDAFLYDEADEQDAHADDAFKAQFAGATLTFEYTEEKWENTVDRKTGTAKHPRQIERVPAGAVFLFEMVYNVYEEVEKPEEGDEEQHSPSSAKDQAEQPSLVAMHLEEIRKAMRLLQDDYLGGHGTRGYGRIAFEGVSLGLRTIKDYQTEGEVPMNTILDDFMNGTLDASLLPQYEPQPTP